MDGDSSATADLLVHLPQGNAPLKHRLFPLREAMLGGVLGVDAICLGVALATLCFSGKLVGGLGLATAAFLASSALMTFVLVAFSAFRNAVGLTQDTSIAILAPVAAMAAATTTMSGETGQIATAFAVIGTATIVSGFVFVLVGVLGLGRIVRLVPYPVAAGFLASSGWLLVLSALYILTKTNAGSALVSQLGVVDVWMSLVPAVVLAAALFAIVHLGGGSVGFVLVIFAAIPLFYAVLLGAGIDIGSARVLGLLQTIPKYGSPDLNPLALYAQIDWWQVVACGPVLAAVVIVNLIGFLLNVSGVELAARRDIDVNRELKLTGFTNLAVGAYGGSTAFMASGATTVAQKIGTTSPALGICYGVVALVGCFFSSQIIAFVPVFVAAGLLIFIGASMLDDWLLQTRKRLLPMDWCIIVGIVAVTIFAGILPAVAAGLALSVFAFAIGYAQMPVIRHSNSGLQRRSTLDRPSEEDAVLALTGGSIRILQLQGFLFFGSVERLIDQLREELGASHLKGEKNGNLILDFSAVTGIDSAGCAALGKLGYVAGSRGYNVHIAAMPKAVLATIERWRLDFSNASGLQKWASVDNALEACETALVDATLGNNRPSSLKAVFTKFGGSHRRTDELLQLMDPIELVVGEILIKQGTHSGDIFILESGRLAVIITKSVGETVKLRSLAPGSIVGEVAHYRNKLRTADVIAETPSKVFRLAEAVMARIEHEDRDLAALVHAMLAHALAEKVVQTNRLVTQV